jgi:hypothetical protein
MRLIDADALIEVLSDKDVKEFFLPDADGVIQLLKDAPVIDVNDLMVGMLNNDYIESFKAEYKQLNMRIEKLYNYLNSDKVNTEEIRPIHEQALAMAAYRKCLKQRAKILKIKLKRE